MFQRNNVLFSFLLHLTYLVRAYKYISNKFKVNFTFNNISSINMTYLFIVFHSLFCCYYVFKFAAKYLKKCEKKWAIQKVHDC